MMGWIYKAWLWAKGNRVVQGPGIEITDAPGGGKQIAATAISNPQTLALYPFKVLIQRNTTGDGFDRGVIFHSKLFGEFGVTPKAAEITITGLLSTDTPRSDDAGFAGTEDGDEIWLELAVGTWPAIATAQIKSKTQDGSVYNGGEIEHDGGTGGPPLQYKQTKARRMIATIESDGAGGLRAVPILTTNLHLVQLSADGFNAGGTDPQPIDVVYPVP